MDANNTLILNQEKTNIKKKITICTAAAIIAIYFYIIYITINIKLWKIIYIILVQMFNIFSTTLLKTMTKNCVDNKVSFGLDAI